MMGQGWQGNGDKWWYMYLSLSLSWDVSEFVVFVVVACFAELLPINT